jgi:hypothetical protein
MVKSEKEKIIVFIKDSLTFILLWVLFFTISIKNLNVLLILYSAYFLVLLLFVYSFEEKSFNTKKIKFNFKSVIFNFSLFTSLSFIFNYLFHNIYNIRINLENGIYFVILDFLMLLWYFIVFNWRR